MITLKDKKLALHYHIEATIRNSDIYYPSYYGRWIDSLSKYFKEIVLITHSNKTTSSNSYKLKSSNISIVDLGEKPTPHKRILNNKKYKNILKNNLHRFDIVGYRVPSPLSRYFYNVTKEKINFFLLVGHMVNAIPKDTKTTWKSLIWRYYWKYDHNILSKIANKNLTLSNGPTFLDEFSNIKNQKIIFTSTIWDDEIVDNRDLVLGDNIKILYLGRISKEKRIDILINTVNKLQDRINIELNIAGSGDENLLLELNNIVNNQNMKNINFLGHISNKKNIKNIMDTNDIFVVPSEWDWQPRTIWEAMSRGMPIVCSKGVKSPYILFKDSNVIEFFETNDSNDLAIKIRNIIDSDIKRKQMIQLSIKTAHARTLEKSAELLVANLTKHVNGK